MAIRSAFSVALLVASVFQVDALRLSEPTAEPAMVALDFERGKVGAHGGAKSRRVSRRDGGGTTKTVLEQLSANDGLVSCVDIPFYRSVADDVGRNSFQTPSSQMSVSEHLRKCSDWSSTLEAVICGHMHQTTRSVQLQMRIASS